MKLVLTPEKILTQKAKPVTKIDGKIRKIISEMKDVLDKSQIGVGLAAPQVGVSLQLFIAAPALIERTTAPKPNPYKIFINPKIKKIANSQRQTVNSKKNNKNSQHATCNMQNTSLEGCLSIPNIWGHVARAPRLTLSYLDEYGNKHAKTFSGFMATIVQHEIDHLVGTLFTHHVVAQGGKLYHQIKNEKTGKMVMEEIKL